MALTELQRLICRLIAANRIVNGESYIAGAVALNELLGAERVSRDIDIFHDTKAAVDTAWNADRSLLKAEGFTVRPEAISFHPGRIRGALPRLVSDEEPK